MSNIPSEEQKKKLLAQMDVTMVQKLAFVSAHFQLHDGAKILDLGCARGLSSYQLALLNPNLQVVGLDYDGDYIKEARKTYQLPNLSYIQGDARDLDARDEYDAILNSSMMHEISSFSNYDNGAVEEALASQLRALKEGGVILLRDFMRPDRPNEMIYLDLPDTKEGHENAQMLRDYARIADSLKPEGEQGFFMEDCGQTKDGWNRFYLSHDRAYEFIWRKEYKARFEPESREKYGVWTASQYRDIPQSMGARVIYTAPYRNPWIAKNWHEGKFRLLDPQGIPLPAPPSNFIAVISKTPKGAPVLYEEHRLAESSPAYLKMTSFQHKESGKIFDMIRRPGAVYDVLPYYVDDKGQLHVFAKSAYPRPIVNIHPRAMTPNIDGRTWSGHMVEPMAVATNDKGTDDVRSLIKGMMKDRAGIDADKLCAPIEGCTYFPAVADVNESVRSYFVPVKGISYEKDMRGAFSNFSSDGSLRRYAAQDLLRGIQVGMLPEARLELNLYALMRKQKMSLDPWIGDHFQIAQIAGEDKLRNTMPACDDGQAFQPTDKSSGYLKTVRSVFNEVSFDDRGRKRVIMSGELEFGLANGSEEHKASTNGAVILPVLKDEKSGEILIGLEKRDFPSMQEWEDRSQTLTLPGFNISPSITKPDELKAEITRNMGVRKESVHALGESYFPSMGILPSRVYPYLVSDESLLTRKNLLFVPVKDVFENFEKLRDANLMIAVMRATHALGLWNDFCAPKAAPSNDKIDKHLI